MDLVEGPAYRWHTCFLQRTGQPFFDLRPLSNIEEVAVAFMKIPQFSQTRALCGACAHQLPVGFKVPRLRPEDAFVSRNTFTPFA